MSYRQAKRLAARYRADGRKGLVHRNTGRRSNRAVPAPFRAHVIALVREQYGGGAAPGPGQRLGPTLAAEHLWSDHGILVPVTSLTRWMHAAGLWSRVRRARPRHQRRERKAHFGELVQLDGSFHDWFEGRGPRACVMAMVDDATGRTVLRFGAEETTWAAARVLQTWIAAYGVPRALYTDWKNVYQRAPTTNELARGEAPVTQCGRMCEKLGILLIGAASPQAKGRVERSHGTHQDRLIKKLRLRGIADCAAANAFVEGEYLAAHNARFAVAPRAAVDYHRPRHRQRWADADVFCLENERVVGNDYVVQYGKRALQLDRRVRGRVPPKSRVVVRETEDGTIRVVSVMRDGRERVLPWSPAAPCTGRRPSAVASPPPPPSPPASATSRLTPNAERRKPAPDHPWRQQQRQWMESVIRRREAEHAREAGVTPEGE